MSCIESVNPIPNMGMPQFLLLHATNFALESCASWVTAKRVFFK